MTSTPSGSGGITRSRLGSGIEVVTERMSQLRSVAVGFWVGTGARDEADAESGASHFLEHLLFKGTARRSALEVAAAVESVGGSMNAFTTHEYTAFYVRVPDDHLALALDVLSDVVWSPALRPDELEAERQVILEEIRMRDDTPDDLVHELLAEGLFPGHRLGRPVIGTPESIRAMSRDQVRALHDVHYRPANVVVAAAGNLSHDAVAEVVERLAPEPSGGRPRRDLDPGVGPEPWVLRRQPTEQAHLALGLRALRHDDPDRFALSVLNQALGGGMSSRLFQEVRERRGLAYSVYSYRASYLETGALVLYAGTAPERASETVEVLHGELDRLVAAGGLPQVEIDDAKGNLRGSLALSLETSTSRMHRLGRAVLVEDRARTLDELAAEIDAVTADDVARVVDRVLRDAPRCLAAVGPVDDDLAAPRAA
ncbi:MAG: insulinase family protein [Acidimicrobiia bacterium]|nr:insulinase family protein [Acidimicrobiia bacterium]